MKIKFILLFTACIANLSASFAQTNVFPSTGAAGIGTTSPDPTSLLDVVSTSKGILIPRMTKTQRDAIVSPATGLMIYQTNSIPGFYYFSGSAWTAVSTQSANKSLSNLTSPTKINTNLLPSADSSLNIGGADTSWKDIYLKGKIYFNDVPVIYVVSSDDFFAGSNAGRNLAYLYGQRNTGVGTNALLYGGYSNAAVGWDAMETDSTGSYNAALGVLSLANNESGNENAAVGNAAMYKNITGNFNTGIGSAALQANFSGSYNVAVGAYSLYSAYSGLNNTAVGYHALYSSTTAKNNTSLGYYAGNSVTTGSSNTLIGYEADVSNGTFTNATAIGNLAVVGASNHIHIGNSSVTSIGGQVGWTSFSDERIKNNIRENVPGLKFINLLKPVTYYFDLNKQENISGRKDSSAYDSKYDIEKIQFTGFLAQDVEAAAKKIGYDFSGVDIPKSDRELYGLRYSDFVVPLVKAVQELSKMNNEKDSMINNLETRLTKIETILNTSLSVTNDNLQQTNLSTASLSQNIPNPFTNTTTINYSLPSTHSSAKIIITDKSGKVLKEIILSANKGSLNIDASTLSSGAYQYSLIVDGRLIDTKQMVLMK